MPCWWECKLVQPLWKTVWRFLRKLKATRIGIHMIQPLGIYSKKMKTLTRKDICTLMFTAALFTIAKIRKQPRHPSMEERIQKILPFVTTWMDLEGIRLSEISQTEKDKYCIISLICEI